MNKKKKTFYDVLPADFFTGIVIRFKTRREAEKWRADHPSLSMVILKAIVEL